MYRDTADPAIRRLLGRSKAMLIGDTVVAVRTHDYTGPYASAITLGIIALIVLILVGVYGRKSR
jgi:ABC-type spermidine/putrescine transport system permease subunit I